MRKTLFSSFAVAALFSAAAVAQPVGTAAERTSFDLTPDALKQILGLLQPEKGCTLTGFTFGTIAPYNLEDVSVVILVYSVEGCGGGNNWRSAIAAFDIKQSGKSRHPAAQIYAGHRTRNGLCGHEQHQFHEG